MKKKLVNYQFPLTLLTTGYICTTKNNFLPKETKKFSHGSLIWCQIRVEKSALFGELMRLIR